LLAKKLYRSRKNRVIAGVCGGLGEYFNIDPVLIRLLWVLATLIYGAGIFAYILAWIIIPEQKESPYIPKEKPNEALNGDKEPLPEEAMEEAITDAAASPDSSDSAESRKVGGIILIVIGAFFLLREIWPFFPLRQLWPLLLIILGLFLIFDFGSKKDDKQ